MPETRILSTLHPISVSMSAKFLVLRVAVLACWSASILLGQVPQASVAAPEPLGGDIASYILGPNDQITVRVLDLDEINDKSDKAIRIDNRGNIILPLVGRLRAAGLTVEQLEEAIKQRLKSVLQDPEVTVSLVDFREQPVSVLGAVKNPGVQQIHTRKTLFEMISLAGGLNPDAGNVINITRRKSAGPLPLPTASDDSTGLFRVASVSVRNVMDAKNPQENIEIFPNDVISVPKADLVYVIGAVKKSGGFILSEKENISVLQALSLAEGLDRSASPKTAKILRSNAASNADVRQEIPVNVRMILAGKAPDVALRADDILFIPTSVPKNAALRSMEAAIQVGTGLAIYRR